MIINYQDGFTRDLEHLSHTLGNDEIARDESILLYILRQSCNLRCQDDLSRRKKYISRGVTNRCSTMVRVREVPVEHLVVYTKYTAGRTYL
jgi:hypothetical protein